MLVNGFSSIKPPSQIFDTILCLDFGSQYVNEAQATNQCVEETEKRIGTLISSSVVCEI